MFSMQSVFKNPLIATFQLSSAASLNLGWSQSGVLGNWFKEYSKLITYRMLRCISLIGGKKAFELTLSFRILSFNTPKEGAAETLWEKDIMLVDIFCFSHNVGNSENFVWKCMYLCFKFALPNNLKFALMLRSYYIFLLLGTVLQ